MRCDVPELAQHLAVWDQTVGCNLCGIAWWGETATHPFEDFHSRSCPLRGRRDVHEASGLINYDYLDRCEDHRKPPRG